MDVVIVVPRAVRGVRNHAYTVTMVMMVFGLRRQPMQAFAEERDAGESRQ
jgi:hypothetical protein